MAAVALVVGNSGSLTSGDTALQSLLTGASHTVTVVDDGDAVSAGKDLHVITESVSPTTVNAKYRDIAVPVVCLEINQWDDLRMTSAASSQNGSSRFFDLEVHEITAGLTPTNNCQIKTTNAGMWGQTNAANLAAGAVIFARHDTVSTHIMGFVIDEGADLTTGTAPARRVALGYIEAWAAGLHANGQTLFLQAVEWALDSAAEPVTGTLDAILPTFQAAIDGQVTINGALTGTLPAIQVSTTGQAVVRGDIDGALPTMVAQHDATVVARGALTGALPAVQMAADGTVVIQGSVAATLPSPAAQMDAEAHARGILDGVLPVAVAAMDGTVESAALVPLAKLPSIAVTAGPRGVATVGTPVGIATVTSQPTGTTTITAPAASAAATTQPARAAVAVTQQPSGAAATTPHPTTVVDITDIEE